MGAADREAGTSQRGSASDPPLAEKAIGSIEPIGGPELHAEPRKAGGPRGPMTLRALTTPALRQAWNVSLPEERWRD